MTAKDVAKTKDQLVTEGQDAEDQIATEDWDEIEAEEQVTTDDWMTRDWGEVEDCD